MKTTIDFLNAVKTVRELTSDYQLAKFLGVTASSISLSMSGRTYLGDETAIKVADALEIDPAQVIASVHYERAKKAEEKAVWKEILERLGGIAAALFIGVALFQIMPDTAADPALFLAGLTGAGNIHYANQAIDNLIFLSGLALFLIFSQFATICPGQCFASIHRDNLWNWPNPIKIILTYKGK